MDHFRRGGLRFPVRDSGPTDGAAVVLLHGFPQDDSTFDAILPALHAAGLRTLVPLQRGYAATARPPHRQDYRTRELVADVVALLDQAGLATAHVVGHDWGGAVAWALATRRPARVASLTVLSTPHPAAFTSAMWRSTQALRSGYMAYFQLPWLPEATLRPALRSMLTRSGLAPEHADRYAHAMAGDALTAALNWYRALPWTPGRAFAPVTVPTTYVWGRRDFALGRAAAHSTARCVAAPYRFVELDAGHWLPENNPGPVAQAILDRVHGTA